MNLWATKPLGEFIEEQSRRLGEKPATIYSVTNENGFVRSLDLFDKQVFSADTSNYKRVEFQDLAYNPSRINVGSIAMCEDKAGGAVSPMYIIVRCKPGLLPRYLLHFLKSETGLHQIRHRCEGAVRFQLKFKDLRAIPVFAPPLSEQERIVRLLDEADELRKLRAKADHRTAELIPSLFHEMFGEIATNRKAFPVQRLGCCIQLRGGFAFKSWDFCNEGIPVIRIGNANKGEFDLGNLAFLPKDFAKSHPRYLIKPYDMVITLTGTVGKDDYGNVCLVSDRYDDWFLNQRLAKVEFKNDKITKGFLFWAFRQPTFKARLIRHNRGVRQANISNDDILGLEIPLPILSLQKEFEKQALEIRELGAGQAASRLRLEALFQSLLHNAFNGVL